MRPALLAWPLTLLLPVAQAAAQEPVKPPEANGQVSAPPEFAPPAGPAPATPAPAGPAPGLREALDQTRDRLSKQLAGVQLSAFGDLLADLGQDGRRELRANAFELDLAGDLTADLQAAGAVTRTGGGSHIPVAFLDYHPFGGLLAPRGQLAVEKGFHIQAGRFDIPYGNDWQFYASKDSTSISRPVTTVAVMDGGYNDEGLRFLGNNGTVNFNAFLLRGFQPGRLVGGRLGLTPFSDPFSLAGTRAPKPAEFGLSFYRDVSSGWQLRETGLAADAEGRLGPCYLRAEYLVRTQFLATGTVTRRGWQFSQDTTLAQGLPWPVIVFSRLEWLKVQDPALASPGGHDQRLVAGLTTPFTGVFKLKLEAQHVLSASPATRQTPGYASFLWLAQLVVIL